MTNRETGPRLARSVLFAILSALLVGSAVSGCRTHMVCGSGDCPADLEPGVASRGPLSAPVLIEEFGEFQCPYCARVQGTLREIERRYPEKIRWVFRHFPLSFHEHADGAARAAIAALRQDRFWPYHDLLFEDPRRLAPDELLASARRLELDMGRFRADMDDPGVAAVIKRDTRRGVDLGVSGVPQFFVNGRRLGGAQPPEAFARIIEEELAKAEQLLGEGMDPEDIARELTARNRRERGE